MKRNGRKQQITSVEEHFSNFFSTFIFLLQNTKKREGGGENVSGANVYVWYKGIIILDVGERREKKLHLKCDLLYDGKHKVLLQKTSVLDVFSHNLTSQEFQTAKHIYVCVCVCVLVRK